MSDSSKPSSSLHGAPSIRTRGAFRAIGGAAVVDAEDTPPANSERENRTSGLPRPLKSFAAAVTGFVRENAVVMVILVAALVARWLLADVNSYWLDEIYSVSIYGIWNDSAMAAVDHLANTSVHPPLYQFILYSWMDWLGDTEVVTRTLSNVYVTLAGLFLYLLTRDAFSRVIAIWTAALFSLMYTTMFFGLETRSYAQTILLATLSSYLLLRMMRAGAARGWRSALISPSGAAFVVANTALLLTHYYNVFFLIAQGLCVAAFVFLQLRPGKWIVGLGTVTAMYGLSGVLFTAVWGRVFVDTYRGRAGEFAVEGGSDLASPIEMLGVSVVGQNITAPGVALITGAILVASTLVSASVKLAGRNMLDGERISAYTTAYLFAWLVLPVTVAYAAFSLLGVARYSDRYFLFSTIPLAPVIVVGIAGTWRLGRSLSPRIRRLPMTGLVGMTSLVVIAATIFPGTYSAATSDKTDWRGTAQDMVGVVESNPDSSYILFETSFRTTPVLDYYLARYSDSLRVDGTIRIAEERRGGSFAFEEQDDVIGQHDYMIVAFTHHSTRHFPVALETLEQRYEIHHRHLGAGGRGYIVFQTNPDPRP